MTFCLYKFSSHFSSYKKFNSFRCPLYFLQFLKQSNQNTQCLGDCSPKLFPIIQTRGAQNIEKRRKFKCTISLDLFRVLHPLKLESAFILQHPSKSNFYVHAVKLLTSFTMNFTEKRYLKINRYSKGSHKVTGERVNTVHYSAHLS